ncbi:hypothetical protein PT158_07000 [Erysipelothrix rhusiopathiae]|nr:hypothetical protein [Erysipelothrix rhusiopathiae]MDE8321981.1 hypothetical protein [Erysipelothrix rhusiopathiae]
MAIKQTIIRVSESDLDRLKTLTGATTMNGSVDIAIQYTLDSFRKDIDFDLQQFLEKIVSGRMQHYTSDILEKLEVVSKEFEAMYLAEGKITDAINDLKLMVDE